MSDNARINGVQISWSSVKLKIEGVPYFGITGIEYGDAVEQAYAYGIGRHHAPRGKTAGKYTPDPLVLTVWKSTGAAIREDIHTRAAGRGLARVPSTIIIQYIEGSDDVITIEASQCTLVKVEESAEEGTDALSEKLTFMPMRILRDGVAMYDTTDVGA